MESNSMSIFLGFIFGGLPLLALLFWWWNELWYVVPLKLGPSPGGDKLPPGHMGFPVIGEMLSFLWYFKILRRPDDYINNKRRKYGDGVGMYRTHLFGSPSIIVCFPMVNKFVLQSSELFRLEWPNVVLGRRSISFVHGKEHSRLRAVLENAINRPEALRRISAAVQPLMVTALESWSERNQINAYNELKKVTFAFIGKLFAGLEEGALLDSMDELFEGMIHGVRAYRLNFPGTAYHHALRCRKKLEAIFREEIEKRKKNKEMSNDDLLDRLMQIEDEEGNQLTDQEIVDNIVGFVVAGYETSALASTWAIYYLAKYPNVLKKLREENMDAMSKRKEGDDIITYEQLSQLKYTNRVVEETIRMANIAAFLFRRATKQVNYKGFIVPANWRVMIWIRYIHTNSENFKDPMVFNPDRWEEAARPGTYQVFGGGIRTCAGNKLARIKLALLLHHLSAGYKWELINPNADIVYLSHPKPADGVEISVRKN